MPEGLFANAPALSRFGYPEDEHKSMFLSHIFDVGSTANMPTHMKFARKPNGDLSVTVCEKIDEQYMQIAALTIQRKDTACRRGRFSMLGNTTHETFKSYQDDDYDPLYTAAYLVGTSGLLFLIYTRASMADDWFIFEPAPPDALGESISN